MLLVHGNISTVADSETGLSYLGSQLAGHGFVAAAIDENFLNTGPWDRSGGLGGIDEARARMILAHLDQWRQWAGDPGSVFHRVIDTDHIGLVGHSRGGEAIAVATRLNAEEHLGQPGPDIGYGLPQVFLDRGRLNPAAEQRSFAAGWVTSVMTAGLRADAGSRENFVAGAVEAGRRAGDGAAHIRGAAPGRAPGRRGRRAGTHHRHLRTR